MRPCIHIFLHFIVPGIVTLAFYKKKRLKTWLIMMATMVVDLDHLLATPVYDPNRCSIGFHPLHSYPAIFSYGVMAAVPKLRIAGIGLLIHMGLDWLDCLWMS